jgi:hypothetical protein
MTRLLVVIALLLGNSLAVADPIEDSARARRIDITTDPLGPFIAFYSVSASYAVTDHIAIRGDANTFDPIPSGYVGMVATGTRRKGYEFGISAPIYIWHAYDGFFIEPGVMVRKRTTCDDRVTMCSDTPVAGPELLAGYHWMHRSGWNVAVAAGAARLPLTFVYADGWDKTHDVHEVVPAMYLRAGYAF